MANENNLGHFLSYNTWLDAVMLEELKIKLKDKNNHFRTINIEHYSRVGQEIRDRIKENSYFEKRIKNNLFYGFSNEFYVKNHVKSKGIYGVRNYKFVSYSINLIHDSIALYLYKISSEFINDYIKSTENIKSYYGGNIRYNNGNLVCKESTVYYREQYLSYRNELKQATNSGKYSIVIKLDIQNYFDNINLKVLLKKLDYFIKPSIKAINNFDETTRKEIELFYDFLMSGDRGIPQIDNDISSSFISYLYLCFMDLEIDSLLKKLRYEEFKIIRYVDDTYILFKTKSTDLELEIREGLNILSEIKDKLFYNFKLKLNDKCKIYRTEDITEKYTLFIDMKNNSAANELAISIDEEDKSENKQETTSDVLNNIFDELEKIKKQGVDVERKKDEIDNTILQRIFDNDIRNLLNKSDNKERLKIFFADFNYDFVKINPMVLTILIMKNECSKTEYINFILGKKIITSDDRMLIIEVLRQESYNNEALIEKLGYDSSFKEIYDIFKDNNANLDLPGYFNLNISKIIDIINNTSIIEQIRLRTLSEFQEDYSVALNHLVNEFQTLCYVLSVGQDKDFNVKSVAKFLKERNINNNNIAAIINMFDRRNNNLISHAGDNIVNGAAVTETEYMNYKNKVKSCLEEIFQE